MLQLNNLVRNLLQMMLASEGELQPLGVRGRQPDCLQPPSFVLSGSRTFGCEGVRLWHQHFGQDLLGFNTLVYALLAVGPFDLIL